MANERAERAERESEYFAALMKAIAERAKLNEADVAATRAKVRAAHEADEADGVLRTDFLDHAQAVRLDGARADAELGADLSVAEPLRH